jgi:hypothetical protein
VWHHGQHVRCVRAREPSAGRAAARIEQSDQCATFCAYFSQQKPSTTELHEHSSELPERMRGMLERGDTNQDGFLSRDEHVQLARGQAASGRRDERRDDQPRNDERR